MVRLGSALACVVLFGLVGFPARALVDPAADVLLVRKDCGSLDDCFETLADALDWTWNTRQPSASDPLVWEMGPGRWDEAWTCPSGKGHVTVRGSGREQTVIGGDPAAGWPRVGGDALSCVSLEFVDLAFEGLDIGFRWQGTGSSVWTDVDIVTVEGGQESLAWVDDACPAGQQEQAVHYFFGSRLIVRDQTTAVYPNSAWYAYCSDAWFYGGEILFEATEPVVGAQIVRLERNAQLRVFGSTIRGVVGPTMTSAVGLMLAASVSTPAGDAPSQFHMHGGIISLDAAAGNVSVVGLVGGGDSVIHTPGTAFTLNPSGTGSATRVVSSTPSSEQSPFLWPAGDDPPVSPKVLSSVDGQDLFVETDCGADGDCEAGGSRAHVMVYNPAACGGSDPWIDAVTGRCRNDTGP